MISIGLYRSQTMKEWRRYCMHRHMDRVRTKTLEAWTEEEGVKILITSKP